MFADHSLKSFPSVIDGLRELAGAADLEIVILTRGPAGQAAELLGQLGLAVVTGSPALYAGV